MFQIMARQVIIYTTPTCPYCMMAKQLLKQLGVKYIEKDVLADKQAAIEMYTKSGQLGTPVLDIDGTIIVGFRPDLILKALGVEEE